jgi:predicted anti-sigma-YlaC factor YlaD
MNCRQARHLFSSYWDDEVTQAEREGLERHLAVCERCRTSYDELARTVEAVSTLPRIEASPDLEHRVLEAVRRTRPAPDLLPSVQPRWVYAPAAAAVLALAVLVGYQIGSAPRGGGVGPDRVALAPTASQTQGAAPVESRSATTIQPSRATGPMAASSSATPDSLFDPAKDLDFVLDPVVLYKGRPRLVTGVPPGETHGQQVVITF